MKKLRHCQPRPCILCRVRTLNLNSVSQPINPRFVPMRNLPNIC